MAPKRTALILSATAPAVQAHTLRNAFAATEVDKGAHVAECSETILCADETDRSTLIASLEKELIQYMEDAKANPPADKDCSAALKGKYGPMLKDAINAGGIDLRSAAGIRFSRYLDSHPDEKTAYKAVKGNDSKSAFRLKWAQSEFALVDSESSYAETLTESELDEGTYEPVDVVYQREGGTPGAWQRTLTYVRRATSMGGSWVRINSMTDGFEVLYIKNKRNTLFAKE
jgi:hypothetical protein